MRVKKQQLEPDMEQCHGLVQNWERGMSRLLCHPAYLTYMQSTSCEMPGLDDSQAGIKIARRNINDPSYADDITLMAENKEELKRLLMRVKEESEKTGLTFNIQKTKIMASGPITSWQTDGETMETVTDFIFLGFKIIAAMKLQEFCSLEEKL